MEVVVGPISSDGRHVVIPVVPDGVPPRTGTILRFFVAMIVGMITGRRRQRSIYRRNHLRYRQQLPAVDASNWPIRRLKPVNRR